MINKFKSFTSLTVLTLAIMASSFPVNAANDDDDKDTQVHARTCSAIGTSTKEIAEQIIDPNSPHFDNVMNVLAAIQDEETRISVSTLTKQLVTNNTDGFDLTHVIKALAAIPDEEIRQSVVKLTKELMTDTMDGQKRLQIISALAKIPDEGQRERALPEPLEP